METLSILSSKLYFVRGIAIVLVVIGHVIGGHDSGIRQMYSHDLPLLRLVYGFVYTFHMPVIFIVSGMSFMLFKKNNQSILDFTRTKLLRITVPWGIWAAFYYVVRSTVPPNNFSIRGLISSVFNPDFIFWFFPVIFCAIFLSYATIQVFRINLAYYLISLFLLYISFDSDFKGIFWIDKTFFYFNFFYAFGVLLVDIYLRNNANFSMQPKFRFSVLAVLFLSFLMVLSYSALNELPLLLKIINGLLGFTVLYLSANILKRKQKFASVANNVDDKYSIYRFISYCGKISMSIYLFHVVCSSSLRELLVELGVLSLPIHLFLGFFVGLIGPIVIYKVFSRHRVLLWSIGEKQMQAKLKPHLLS